MPKESLSVYLTAIDGISPVFATITDKTRALDKESQELQQTYENLQKANAALIAKKVELEKSLKIVDAGVREAKKNFKAFGDELSEDTYEKALKYQQKLRDELTATNKSLRENQAIYKENIETIRKNALGGEGQGTGLGDIARGIFAGQVGQMLSSSIGGLGQSVLTSAIGTPEASLVSDTLSGIIAGAAAGSILPGIGTAIGAALGGASGLISGGTKIFEAKDDAFKDYYGGLYDDVKGRSGEMVEAGTSLASTRETNRISFTTLFDGDEDRARGYLEDLIDMANSTPFLYDDLVSMSKTLATYGYDDSNILPLLQTIGDTGAALGMSTSDMNTVGTALGRMKSSDKATLEWLNILNDRGIGAVGMLADAYGVSQKDMYGKISKGEISGAEAVEIITAALSRDKKDGGFAGSMAEQSQTFSGISSTLEGLQQNLNALGGERYNALRQSGKEAEVNALNGDLGDAIGEINRIIGENQARKENLQDQYMREALETVLLGRRGTVFSTEQQVELNGLAQEYAQAKRQYEESGRTDGEAAAKMESLYEQAQALGQAYFENSDFVKTLNDLERDEIQAIRENTAGLDEATQASYKLSQELSKGLAVKWVKDIYGDTIAEGKGGDISQVTAASSYLSGPEQEQDGYYTYSGVFVPYSHAFGLPRVPYDEYPALLHADERVLTAEQARAQDAQNGAPPLQLTVTGNSFVGTGEEMADQVAEIIVRKLVQNTVAAAPK